VLKVPDFVKNFIQKCQMSYTGLEIRYRLKRLFNHHGPEVILLRVRFGLGLRKTEFCGKVFLSWATLTEISVKIVEMFELFLSKKWTFI